MRKLRFSRLGPASAGIVAGLVLATAGTGYAASKYVITSTKQISPKVVRQLKGKAGPQGAQGPQGAPGPQGPQGAAGTARASGQVVTGGSPRWGAQQGFPGAPRRADVGKYCLPAPAGVNPDTTAVVVGLSGDVSGFVSQAGPPAQVCRANEFEIWTTDKSDYFSDSVYFTIVVP